MHNFMTALWYMQMFSRFRLHIGNSQMFFVAPISCYTVPLAISQVQPQKFKTMHKTWMDIWSLKLEFVCI